jgi:hypothetical protein
MAIYIGNNKVIDNYNEFLVGQYATRASLPAAGVVGYLSYVTDQNELVINTGQTTHPSSTNNPPAPGGVAGTNVNYLVVAGGGGGSSVGAGGGAGGLLFGAAVLAPGAVYPIVVGTGGAVNTNGQNSSALGVSAIGGGAGSSSGTGGLGGVSTSNHGYAGGGGVVEVNPTGTIGGGGGGSGSAGGKGTGVPLSYNFATPTSLQVGTSPAPWKFLHDGTTDWTAECWFKASSTNIDAGTFFYTSGNAQIPGIWIGVNDIFGDGGQAAGQKGSINLFIMAGGPWAVYNTAINTWIAGQWNHVAVTFNSTTKGVNIFLNGIQLFVTKDPHDGWNDANFSQAAAVLPLYLGSAFIGSVFNWRITKSLVYTSDFNVPTSSTLPVLGGTVLDYIGGTATESSPNAYTIINQGAVASKDLPITVSISIAGGSGGAGVSSSISGSAVTYAGGGAGWEVVQGSPATAGTSGTPGAGSTNYGGGGSGSYLTGSQQGLAGVVIIAYAGGRQWTGGTITTAGGNTIHTFTSSGSLTFTGNTSPATNGPDTGVTWYKILTNSISNQLQQVLTQGTLAGGYTGSAIWNEITKITFASDSSLLLQQTMPWATRYSTAHSTNLYAYYHTGDVPGTKQSAKQSWTTYAVSLLSSARTIVNGSHAVTFQSGLAIDPTTQNIGVIQYGPSVEYINFTTDTWATDNRYSPPVVEYYGFAASGALYSYATMNNTQKFNWTTSAWSSTGASGPYTGPLAPNTIARGGMSTGWNKAYNGSYQYMDKLDEAVDTWTGISTSWPSFVEISTLPGQNWGYWFGIPYNTAAGGNYAPASRKTLFATDTTFDNPQTSVGVGGWGSASAPGGVIDGINYAPAVDGDPASGNSACTSSGP